MKEVLADEGAGCNHVFDRLGRDLLALAQLENVFDAVGDAQLALFVQGAHVARPEPAVLETLLVRRRVAQVLLGQTPPFDQYLALPDPRPIFNVSVNIV